MCSSHRSRALIEGVRTRYQGTRYNTILYQSTKVETCSKASTEYFHLLVPGMRQSIGREAGVETNGRGVFIRSCSTLRAHLIGLQKICFQKIKNQNWALIGRSVSTSTMVILIFRKIYVFSQEVLGDFLFLFSGCLFYSCLLYTSDAADE